MNENQLQNKNMPEQHQTYKYDDVVILVKATFKTEGDRMLLHSLGKIIDKGIKAENS